MPESSLTAPVAARPAARVTAAPAPRPGATPGTRIALIVGFTLLAIVNLAGATYYLEPIGVRVRDPLHAWLKPSGPVGQSAGIVALGMFLLLYLYPLRRRIRALAFTGSLARWLDLHIVAGLLVPAVGATHAAWRFQGLIGLGYLSMLLVAMSGIVGRYLYVHIPRGRTGAELGIAEVEERRRELVADIARRAGMSLDEAEGALALPGASGTRPGLPGTIVALATDDLWRWRRTRALRRAWRRSTGTGLDGPAVGELARLAGREIALAQQMRLLAGTERLFRLWHVVHRPFALTAFVAVVVHVAVVVALGVTWFR